MDIIAKITEELKVKKWQVEAAIGLIDEGNTIPFISRYRKEATGSLNDEQLRDLDERLKYLRGLEERKETVLASIEEQGKLTDELKQKINEAEIRSISTFPQDYQSPHKDIGWLCGMSVPPVMTAQIAYQIYKQWLTIINNNTF